MWEEGRVKGYDFYTLKYSTYIESHKPFCFIPNQHKCQYLSYLIYIHGSKPFTSHLAGQKASTCSQDPICFPFLSMWQYTQLHMRLSQIIRHIVHLLKSNKSADQSSTLPVNMDDWHIEPPCSHLTTFKNDFKNYS